MFQNDAITYVTEISGVTTDIFTDSGDHTILSVAMQQQNNSSQTVVKCGNNIVAKNYATNFGAVQMNYQCPDDILQISKTGNDNSTVIVTYVPYLTGEYSTTTQFGYNPTTEISTSSDVQIFGAISAGEILIAVLIIGLIFINVLNGVVGLLDRVKTQKKYLGYSSGDVPIDKQL